MKVAIYTRVSTEEQDPEHQARALKEFSNNRNYEVFKIYKDVISGAKASRPALSEMMQDAYNKKFDAVVIWKLDRLGRSLQHLIDLLNKLVSWKIDLICQTQEIDTTTASGRLMIHLIGAFAEFERSIISERTKLALKNNKKVGKRGKDKKQRKKGGYYLRYQKK